MRLQVLVIAVSAAALSGCANPNVKGSWGCATSPGVNCASIAQIDSGEASTAQPATGGRSGSLPSAASRVMTTAMTVSTPAGAPYREADPVMKIVLAPWVDAAGDYHGTTPVFAVMRRGQWWQTRSPAPALAAATSASAPAEAMSVQQTAAHP